MIPLNSVIIQRNSIIFETSKNQNKSKSKQAYSVTLRNKLKFQRTKSEKRSSMKFNIFKPTNYNNQFREWTESYLPSSTGFEAVCQMFSKNNKTRKNKKDIWNLVILPLKCYMSWNVLLHTNGHCYLPYWKTSLTKYGRFHIYLR